MVAELADVKTLVAIKESSGDVRRITDVINEVGDRYALLARGQEPILWDFGSAARHHQIYCDWMGERSRAGIPLMRELMRQSPGVS